MIFLGPLLTIAIGLTVLSPAWAQEHTRVNGTVLSISGQSLTLNSDTPISSGRPLLGFSLRPPPGARAGLYVDLRELTEREYGSIRPGDRISVAGVISDGGLIATSISQGSGQQSP